MGSCHHRCAADKSEGMRCRLSDLVHVRWNNPVVSNQANNLVWIQHKVLLWSLLFVSNFILLSMKWGSIGLLYLWWLFLSLFPPKHFSVAKVCSQTGGWRRSYLATWYILFQQLAAKFQTLEQIVKMMTGCTFPLSDKCNWPELSHCALDSL